MLLGGAAAAGPLAVSAQLSRHGIGARGTPDLECRRVRDRTCVCGHVLLSRSLESKKIGKGVLSGNPKNLKKGPPGGPRLA
jgi:hypothetical protein